MASFFGEIIEPSTRAIFDEFSDEEENATEPEFQLCLTGDEKLPSLIDVFFVFQGRLSLAFAEEFLLNENSSVTAKINIVEKDTIEFDNRECHRVKSLPSRIFTDKNRVICLVSPSVPSELGYNFCQCITPLLKISKRVVVFTNDSLHNYKTQYLHDLPCAFMKQLDTSHGAQKCYVEPLEPPNFITGIPAGVISWCQIYKKSASAFVCYTDQEKLDSITAKPYIGIFRKIQPDAIKSEKPDSKTKTFYGKPGLIGASSNIYM